MNFDHAEQINPHLERLDFSAALEIAETALKKLPPSDFHYVLGRSLTKQAPELAAWIDQFYKVATKKIPLNAMYFEMNEFDINTDNWYIDGFGYKKDQGLDPDDMDWLSDPVADTRSTIKTIYGIDGYEPLQKAFEKTKLTTPDLQNARDWCEQIIIARFMELMRATHLEAAAQKLSWSTVPIYFTEHSYDFIVRSAID